MEAPVRTLLAQRSGSQSATAQTVAMAKSGERDAIRSLYLSYKDAVYRYVLSMVRDQHEAEDVTQHVFLKLMCVIDSYEPCQAPFTSWLLRVARIVAVDHLRGQPFAPWAEVHALQRVEVSARTGRRRLERALEVLSEQHRDGGVVALRHLVGLTPVDGDCAPMARAAAS